jgi:predicted nuclease of predicted toxin-antitoxin system
VRFVVDAQLPPKLSRLAGGGRARQRPHVTPSTREQDADTTLADLADDEDRVVVAKDRDFRNSHLLRRSPRRLLIVSTGNVANAELVALFAENLDTSSMLFPKLTTWNSAPAV